ncbi:hypothetical protein [Ramlibacter sp. WS9]|uniref:hypothetical protein n=1 Tax=Ramlibacter sp. WS9 TaxID=1882741 RepID=UPI001142E998|nr:hypothetical protein [Ramlibacter sp. WS9]ROZ61453.1 hypothetical protein EEB15_32720 [Ramlibacter sp. WS9]
MQELRQFQADRSLIALRRAAVDDNKIQGFVLGSSDQLVLLQYVYDLNVDGLMILRTHDISKIECSKTEVFQRQRLADEGLLSKVRFDYAVNLNDWRSAFEGLRGEHSIFILECELIEEPDFAIGRIQDTGEEEVRIQHFTGAGNWLEEPVQFKYNDITSCQVGTNYANVYQRFFERNAP